jgi:hypothetical protein
MNELMIGIGCIVLGLIVLFVGIWAGRFYSKGGREK